MNLFAIIFCLIFIIYYLNLWRKSKDNSFLIPVFCIVPLVILNSLYVLGILK